MLEGGLRLSHAIYIVENYNPEEVVEINGLEVDTPRLVCLHDKGFCRYYVGVRETAKRARVVSNCILIDASVYGGRFCNASCKSLSN
jgi:hypothetical protein